MENKKVREAKLLNGETAPSVLSQKKPARLLKDFF